MYHRQLYRTGNIAELESSRCLYLAVLTRLAVVRYPWGPDRCRQQPFFFLFLNTVVSIAVPAYLVNIIWVSRKRKCNLLPSIFSLCLSYFLPQFSDQCRRRQEIFFSFFFLLLCLPEVDWLCTLSSLSAHIWYVNSRSSISINSSAIQSWFKSCWGKYNSGGQWIVVALCAIFPRMHREQWGMWVMSQLLFMFYAGANQTSSLVDNAVSVQSDLTRLHQDIKHPSF